MLIILLDSLLKFNNIHVSLQPNKIVRSQKLENNSIILKFNYLVSQLPWFLSVDFNH